MFLFRNGLYQAGRERWSDGPCSKVHSAGQSIVCFLCVWVWVHTRVLCVCVSVSELVCSVWTMYCNIVNLHTSMYSVKPLILYEETCLDVHIIL